MGTKYEGSAKEKLALDTYIKFVRAFDAMKGRIEAQNTVGDHRCKHDKPEGHDTSMARAS